MTVFVGRCGRHTRPLSWAAEEAGCISSACTLRVQPARCVACIYQPVATVCITCTLCRLGWPTFADSCCFTRSTLVPWNCPHFCWPSGDRRRYTECPLFQNYTVVMVGAIDCRVMDWTLWIVILWNSRLESCGYCTTKLFSVYYYSVVISTWWQLWVNTYHYTFVCNFAKCRLIPSCLASCVFCNFIILLPSGSVLNL